MTIYIVMKLYIHTGEIMYVITYICLYIILYIICILQNWDHIEYTAL